jgi:hypothetical protein
MASSPGRYLVLLGIASAVFAASVFRREPKPELDGFYAVSTIDGVYRIPSVPNNFERVVALTNLDRDEPQVFKLTRAKGGQTNLQPLVFSLPSEPDVTKPDARVWQATKPLMASQRREFRVHRGDGPLNDVRFYHSVTARLVGSNAQINVFQHPQAEPPDPERLADLLQVAADKLELVSHLLNHTVSDIDGDGRFSILLVPRPDRDQPTAFICPADYQTTPDAGVGNRADLMYVSSDIPPRPLLDAIVAHEFAHAIRCSAMPEVLEEDWLHEGLAHSVERLATDARQNIDHRISRYLEQPERYSLVVPDYFTAGLFREHGSRGATATFLHAMMQGYGERRLLSQLVSAKSVGADSLSGASGERFPSLLRRWTKRTLEQSPHVDGDFVLIGPRTIQWDGESHLELRVMPTATVFVDVSNALHGVGVTPEVQELSQASVFVSPMTGELTLDIERSSGELVVQAARLPITATRLVVGVETTVNSRSTSRGLQSLTTPNLEQKLRFSLSETDGSMLIKAFVELPDGRFLKWRALSEDPGSRVTFHNQTKLR